jgi:capsular polysaccharide biosynthesis protein
MSEIKRDEYIEISLTNILVSIVRNIKIFIVILVLGGLFSVAIAFLYKPTYHYKQMIQPPFYLSGKAEVSILDGTKLDVVLNNILEDKQQNVSDDRLLNDIQVLAPGSVDKNQKRIFFSLSVNAKLSDKQKVCDLFDLLMNDFSDSMIVKKQVELWKQNLHRNIELNQKNIDRYQKIINSDNRYLKELSSSKNVGTLQGQTLLASYTNQIERYQGKVFSLQDQQQRLSLELSSLQPKLSSFGNITYTKTSKLSKVEILLIGIVLSIFVSLFIVFIKVVLSNAIAECKKLKEQE